MLTNPYQAYKKQSIMTMTSGDMLTALYDGLIKNLTRALSSFEKKDYAEINQSLQKSQAILRHLQSSLDFQYEISTNLDTLYDYFLHTTIQANVKKNADGIPEIIEMITELRDTYVEAGKQTHLAAANK